VTSKPPRPPPNTPDVGDRVRLRGRDPRGVLSRVDERKWSWVDWDADAVAGPKIVYLFELERIAP
jgi:hypothetical protein